ncbi:MAG: ABC transporter permease [Aquificaceae bacterium]
MRLAYILYQLVKRDIKIAFAGSMFGTVWMLLNPLLTTGVFYIIFQHIVKVRFPQEATYSANYTVYLLTGLAFWNGFTQSLTKGMNSLLDNAFILKKTSISPYLFLTASTITGFIYAFVSLSYALIIHNFPYSFQNFPLVLASLAVEFVFVLGLVFLLGSLCVYVRDIAQIVSTLLSFIFYSLPIIYPASYVPDLLKPLLLFNPLYYILRNVQTSLLLGHVQIKEFLISFGVSFITLSIGLFFYRLLRKGFYDVL